MRSDVGNVAVFTGSHPRCIVTIRVLKTFMICGVTVPFNYMAQSWGKLACKTR